MARNIRIEYGGAAYHVMARRKQGREIHADDHDRKSWLATLGEACRCPHFLHSRHVVGDTSAPAWGLSAEVEGCLRRLRVES
ncbi:MAG: hypothetical protein ACLQU3_09115 [Limisphaerales bacterium]